MKLIALFAAVTLSAIGCSKPAPVAVVDSYCLVKYHNIPSDPEIVCQGENIDAMRAELVKFKRGIAEQADDSEKDYAAKMGWDKSKPPVRITLRDGARAWGCHPDDTLVGVSRVPQEDVDGRIYTLSKKGFWCIPNTGQAYVEDYGNDGLHPNDLGYDKISDLGTIFGTVRQGPCTTISTCASSVSPKPFRITHRGAAKDAPNKSYEVMGESCGDGRPAGYNSKGQAYSCLPQSEWPKIKDAPKHVSVDLKADNGFRCVGQSACDPSYPKAKDAPKPITEPETQLWSSPKDEHGCTYPFNWSEGNSTCVFNLQFAGKSMVGLECSRPTGEAYGKLRCSYNPDPKVEPKQ